MHTRFEIIALEEATHDNVIKLSQVVSLEAEDSGFGKGNELPLWS